MSGLCFESARVLARMVATRKISATELVKAFIAQIERVNPKVNAIVTFLPELALSSAKALDRNFKKSKPGVLAGLPIAGGSGSLSERFDVIGAPHSRRP